MTLNVFRLLNAIPFRPKGKPYIYNIFNYILAAYHACLRAISCRVESAGRGGMRGQP